MRPSTRRVAGLVLAILVSPRLGRAQTPTPAIEPEAMAALNSMGAYLRTLKAFQVRAATTTRTCSTTAKRSSRARHGPPRRARTACGRRWSATGRSGMYFYDGKTFTLFAQRVGYYATGRPRPRSASWSTGSKRNTASRSPRGPVPLGGTAPSAADIKSAADIGPSVVEGTTCEHYAFRQPGLDWQVWIQQGDYPLPRSWCSRPDRRSTAAAHGGLHLERDAVVQRAAFTFDPPSGGQKIVIAEASASAAPSRSRRPQNEDDDPSARSIAVAGLVVGHDRIAAARAVRGSANTSVNRNVERQPATERQRQPQRQCQRQP